MCCEDGCCYGDCCCCCCKDGASCDVFLSGVCSLFAGWGVFIVGLALFLVNENPAMRIAGIIILSFGVAMIVSGFTACCCIGCDCCECCRDLTGDCCTDTCSCCKKQVCCCFIDESGWQQPGDGCCTCCGGGTQSGGWSHSQGQGDTDRQPNGGWSHSHAQGNTDTQPNGGWSHSQPDNQSKCCIHCVCCEGGISSGWNHRGTRWAQDYAPTVTVIRNSRIPDDPTVMNLQPRNPNSETWDGQQHEISIWTTDSTNDVIDTQPTAPYITISGASDTNPSEPPSYASIMAARHMHRMRTPGLSPHSGATPFDPPPEYEEVV